MALSEEQEQAVLKLVHKDMVLTCKAEGVNFYTLDKRVQKSMIAIFQLGVGFMERMKTERAEIGL